MTDKLLSVEEGNKISWGEYKLLHPPKPYEQSEKWGDYDQRISDHFNNLFVQYQQSKQSTLK